MPGSDGTFEAFIDWHMAGEHVAEIEMMVVPKDQRRRGIGRDTYEAWESDLPETIHLVKLWCADADGSGKANAFWEAMGFDYKYTAADPTHIANEDDDIWWWMWKGVNGHPTPQTIVIDPDELNEADEGIRGGHDGQYDDPDYYDSIRKRGAAGVFFIARSTGRILLGHRSSHVDMPRHWGGFGGAIDEGETAESAVRREIIEELGFHGSYDLRAVFCYKSPTFSYQNFVAFVEDEFTPRLNWEHTDADWFEMDHLPAPLHPGLKMCLADGLTQEVIQQGLHLNESTAIGRHYAANPVPPEIDEPSEIRGTKLHYPATSDVENKQKQKFSDRMQDQYRLLHKADGAEREPIVKKLNQIRSHSESYGQRLAAKRAARVGMNARDFEVVHAALTRYTQKSYQKLDPRVLKLARKMTVVPSLLPHYVYRGIYIDGAKIKNRDAFITQWSVGSHPHVKPGKPTSWTAVEGIAYDFMRAQDNVEDRTNGFYVLLRYDLSKDDSEVVADLRNLPGNRFWNQQEIILSKDAVDYEVAAIFDNEEGYEEFRDSSGKDVIASGSGATENALMLRNIFRIAREIPTAPRAEWSHRYLDLTVGQYETATHSELVRHQSPLREVALPLFWFIHMLGLRVKVDEVISKDDIHCVIDPSGDDYYHGPGVVPLNVRAAMSLTQSSPKKFVIDITLDARGDEFEHAQQRIEDLISERDTLLSVNFHQPE